MHAQCMHNILTIMHTYTYYICACMRKCVHLISTHTHYRPSKEFTGKFKKDLSGCRLVCYSPSIDRTELGPMHVPVTATVSHLSQLLLQLHWSKLIQQGGWSGSLPSWSAWSSGHRARERERERERESPTCLAKFDLLIRLACNKHVYYELTRSIGTIWSSEMHHFNFFNLFDKIRLNFSKVELNFNFFSLLHYIHVCTLFLAWSRAQRLSLRKGTHGSSR